MLILFHKNNKVVKVLDRASNQVMVLEEKNILKALFILASNNCNRIISWCHHDNEESIDTKAIASHFTTKNVMISQGNITYLRKGIGYVEDSPFINVNRKVKFPTWLMHSNCGAIYGEILLMFKEIVNFKKNFNYNLNSIAKKGVTKGLFCYYTPNIVDKNNDLEKKASTLELFQFVKEHFKARWIVILFINKLIFEKKVSIIPFIKTLFVKQKQFKGTITSEVEITDVAKEPTLSVLIPTLGRAKYLHYVLKDLANQTLKPVEVIIIEQDDSTNPKTELDYLKTEDWPFKIIHKLISQTGVCNARNIGLKLITSDYVFMADDDIRFNKNTINNAINFMLTHSHNAITLSCLRDKEIEKRHVPIQWASFGSGCSIVKTNAIKDVNFDMTFEHGFGEDTDFGMQLRNKGIDIIYLPSVKLLHLKAPIGGFRNKHIHEWEKQGLIPKPSPTIMLYVLKYKTLQQLRSYKLTLFLKFYKRQSIKNPFKYYNEFKKRWELSKIWAEHLKNKSF